MSTHSQVAPQSNGTRRRPPLGPNARRVVPFLALVNVLRAVGLVGFAAAIGTLLAALAKAAFAAAAHGEQSGVSAGWAEFVGDRSAGADGLFPAWMIHAQAGNWSWTVVVVGLVSLVLRAGADWALSVLSQRAAADAKSTIRRGLIGRLLSAPGPATDRDGTTGDGAIAVLVSRGLDALDDYYVRTISSLVGTAVIPVVLLIVVLWADPVSALVLVLTLPLVPIFMILIGKTTEEDTRHAQSQLLRLSQHIVELSRGLPVLVGLRREKAQARALSELGEQYRRRTMTTLRSAFQSSLALELITTISVALVAVFIGLRLVNGHIGLDTALLVLLLAPECFQPLRDMGTAFHQSQDGVEALRRTDEILEAPVGDPVASVNDGGSATVSGLTVGHPGRGEVLRDVSFTLHPGTCTVLTGPSGSGKTTLLSVLGGLVRAHPDDQADAQVHVSGQVSTPENVAWIGQSPHFLAATAADEVGLYADPEDADVWLRDFSDDVEESLGDHAARVRRQWWPVVESALRAVGLESVASVHPASLSAGQARRLAIARVAATATMRLAVGSGSGRPTGYLVLVDEPTAHLDADASARVTQALQTLCEAGATLLWVTHDPSTVPGGSRHLALDDRGRMRELPRVPASTQDKREPAEPEGARADRAPGTPRTDEVRTDAARGILGTVADVGRATGIGVRQGLGSVGLSFLTVAFGASLTALSGWLIVRASEQPGMMYLMVAIVGVRFFGLGRAVFRYLERLVTHGVVLRAANRLRMNAWNSTGESALGFRSLLRGGTFLDRLVGDVDEVRDAVPRVLLPVATNIPVMIGALVATWLTVPSAVWLMVVACVVSTVLIPWVVLRADRRADVLSRDATERTLRGAISALESAEDLRGNRLHDAVVGVFTRQDHKAVTAARRSAFAAGLGNGLTLAVWWATAVGILVIARDPVTNGTIGVPVAAIPVLLCTALVEPASQATEAVRSWPAFSRLVARIRSVSTGREVPEREESPGEESEPAAVPVTEARTLTMDDVAARWPGMDRPAVHGMSGSVDRGSMLGITGPSGSGKTTTLAVLLGFLPAEHGAIRIDGDHVPARRLRGAFAWCPQDAYVFDSTLRGNLSLARPREAAPTDHELRSVMQRVGLGPFLGSLDTGLDTRVGPGGSRLSGGQRQRLSMARALLTESPFLLVDEPTAHLDEESATGLIEELNRVSRSSSVAGGPPGTIVISHRPLDLVHCRSVVSLAGRTER